MTPKWIYCKTDDSCLGIIVDNEELYNQLKDIFTDRRHGKVTQLTKSAALDMVNKAKAKIKEEDTLVEPITLVDKPKTKVAKKKVVKKKTAKKAVKKVKK